MAGIEKDVRNPELRRKVKSNLNQNQKDFIKEVKVEYPKRGLRLRREDKGARFVIEDAITEDDRITEKLSDPTYYRESDNDPIEDYRVEIKQWADTALEKGELDDKQSVEH